ncbi:hypothetical protein OIDMADRAFT_58251 [Oidiodendron maius Zn]|uniref:BZIP domain-containing protein n=1 Tax=Oidiodendron maius (strain Zn) TaxID=913774 RepID=A0A0C3D428_OIDMZ|nr:hypothetical protein OIDMADRAFT_58251 [Oidiodendron maius Zn]
MVTLFTPITGQTLLPRLCRCLLLPISPFWRGSSGFGFGATYLNVFPAPSINSSPSFPAKANLVTLSNWRWYRTNDPRLSSNNIVPPSHSMETDNTRSRRTEYARSQGDGQWSEAEAVPSKPWASGRTLTAAQRARKRALDRQSHRQRRDKTESRIAELEASIKALLDERGDAQTSSENRSHDTSSQRPEHIPDLISKSWNLQDFVGTGAWTSSPPDASISAISPDRLNCDPSDSNSSINGATALNSTNEMGLATPEQVLPSNVGQPLPRITAAELMVADSPTVSTLPVQSIAANGGISTTQLCNMELSKASQLTSNQVCRDELVNQDSIIRAILQGWETIEGRGYVCPLWETLHRIDDLIFCRCSNITRLVMLYTVHRMLLCCAKAKSFKELPPWYRPRPAQCRFQHEIVMGYFAWPGLRERLVLSEKRILSDSFWHYFAHCFSFHWPYSLADAYNVDLAGQARFSGAFMNYLQDIGHWRMDHRFFAAFPDLSNDIIPAPAMPLTLTFPQSCMVSTLDPPASSTFSSTDESEEAVALEDICGTSSSFPNLIMRSQDPWNLSQLDFAIETTPAWAQAVDSFFRLPS